MQQYMRLALGLTVFLLCMTAISERKGFSMGTPDTFSGKTDSPAGKSEKATMMVAFVLLSEGRLPGAEAIVRAFPDFAASGQTVRRETDTAGKSAREQAISLTLNTGEKCFVALMPVPVPNGEADEGAPFSLSSLSSGWKLPPHRAHLVVTFQAATGSPPVVHLSRFTSLVAAVTKASPSVGVYWGSAGVTHDPEFFTSVASDQDLFARLMLWSGVSVARESDGRLSLLSLGMKQLDLPDLLLVAGKSSQDAALETMFLLLAYLAERGEALPEGDTVGRTDDEMLPVRYVTSPVDPSTKVWRVELP